MEKEIKKLKKLADKFANLIVDKPLQDFIYFDNKNIRIYFSSQGEYSIKFKEVEICEWTNAITLPVNFNKKDLKKIYIYAIELLNNKKNELQETVERRKKEIISEIKENIVELEEKLAKLESEQPLQKK